MTRLFADAPRERGVARATQLRSVKRGTPAPAGVHCEPTKECRSRWMTRQPWCAHWREDQCWPSQEAHPDRPRGGRGPGGQCCSTRRLHRGARQGGAALGLPDARGVTPGTTEKPRSQLPFAPRRCIASRPFARSVRLLRHLALPVEHCVQLRAASILAAPLVSCNALLGGPFSPLAHLTVRPASTSTGFAPQQDPVRVSHLHTRWRGMRHCLGVAHPFGRTLP
jgi:hypothetical protein